MAQVLDTTNSTVSTVNQTTGGTTTLSYTVGSLTNGALIVSLSTWNNGGTGTGCSGVTYNGVAMTKVGSGASNGSFYTEQWVLAAPASGTHNIVATVSGKTDKLGMSAASFSGVDQTTVYDVNNTATGTSGSVTASLTTAANGEYMIDCVSHLSANNPTAHSNTQIYSDATSGTSTVSQYGVATTAGSNSMSWTYPDPGDGWAYSILALKDAGGGGGVSVKRLALLGVG